MHLLSEWSLQWLKINNYARAPWYSSKNFRMTISYKTIFFPLEIFFHKGNRQNSHLMCFILPLESQFRSHPTFLGLVNLGLGFFFFFLVLFSLGAHSRDENHTRLLDGAQTSMCIQDLEEATAFAYLAMQNISSLSISGKKTGIWVILYYRLNFRILHF